MRLLLGSGGLRTPERLQNTVALMRAHFGSIRKILFVPYAGHDFNQAVQSMQERGLDADFELDSIHRHSNPRQAIEQAEGIFVGGGNTFRLLATMQELELLEPMRQRVMAGLPYMGVSAGTNLACPTIKTTNDMPIILPPRGLAALNLVPFQVNPHYFLGQVFVKDADGFHEHFGETRDERIQEFHQHNTAPVIGLWEGAFLSVSGAKMTLHAGAARIFQRDFAPKDISSGADASTLLETLLPTARA